MIKITIEEEGKEPRVIECRQYILRADTDERTVTKGDHNLSFLTTTAAYLTEMARIGISNDIKGQ